MTRPFMLITGASAGIGAATAKMAATRGYDLGITYNADQQGAEDVATQARAAGARALVVQADVANPSSVEALFAAVDDFGPLSVLVNNAGIVAPALRIEEMPHDRLRQVIDVNLMGTLYCAQAAVRRMARRYGHAGGSIVNISSVAAELGAAGQYADYAAAKAAVDTLTRSLSLENADQGIRVNAVRPGIIDTAIHGKGGDPDRAARMGETAVPMGRAGTAEEIAEAILWLASDAASYVTGDILKVSGGR